MDMMEHRHGFELFNGRTPGGAGAPVVAADYEALPDLPPVTAAVTVAVVDTGMSVDADGQPLPWFGDHVDFDHEADVDAPPRDEDADAGETGSGDHDAVDRRREGDGHGTFVAGLVLAEAPTVRVLMKGAIDADNERTNGFGLQEDGAVRKAIEALRDVQDLAVVNLSFGGVVEEFEPEWLREVLASLGDDVAVIAAAGNNGSEHMVWPAGFEEVIAVGAVDTTIRLQDGSFPVAAFSNHGGWVDVYAPGVSLLGPRLPRRHTEDGGAFVPPWARWSGTSFAAAVVSGRIAALAAEREMTGKDAAAALLADAGPVSGSNSARLVLSNRTAPPYGVI